jgi:hypothetical protein
MKGDFKNNGSTAIYEISPCPSFPKRGIFNDERRPNDKEREFSIQVISKR